MESVRSKQVLVAYVSVPHAGYLKLFRRHEGDVLYILGNEFTNTFPSIVRHLPGVTPEESQKMIQSLDIFSEVHILTRSVLERVKYSRIIMPDEDVSRSFAEQYLADAAVVFDGSWRLRWDWGATQLKRRPEGESVISVDVLDKEFMRQAFQVAERSPDWWRQIGALLVKDGQILLSASNQHVPSEQSAYCYGDPRSNFEPGQHIDASVAQHAERGIISAAAREGIKMKGTDLYVTTFPCPPCAYAVAFTGIRRLFYVDGYALVAGAEVLRSQEVQILRVVL